MTTTRNLLVELFVEELPPKALKNLGDAFASILAEALSTQGLSSKQSVVNAFASPRRLAAHISGVHERAEDKSILQKLMPVSVGLSADGQPTPALLKKLASLGADASVVPELKRQMDGKAEALFFDSFVKGISLTEGLQKALDEALTKLPIPKVMQYQLADGWTSVNFVRPAHGLVALHGTVVVPVKALGLAAGRQTHGHRFEAPIDPIVLQDADHYARQLEEQGGVIASFATRHAKISRQLHNAASQNGLVPIEDAELLDEVTALVEQPNVLLCEFDPEFLSVPQECLILTMKANQKYFPLLGPSGKLTNKFLVVSNIHPLDPRHVIGGNERVVRPRLADAKFFFDQDRKKTLASRVPGLAKVVYHHKLGTQGDRVERVRTIARNICNHLREPSLAPHADQAALLAKADLLTDMVGEFPELQGIMGGYYARHDGLSDEIAFAIEDHYKPRFAGDELPRNLTGVVVALADKLETLAGLFGIGQVPSGDKDPFALRRHALGVVRLLIDKQLPLPLPGLISDALATLPCELVREAHIELETFIFERLASLLRDRGYTAYQIDALLSLRPARIDSVLLQIDAVRNFSTLAEAPALAAANKRIGNILKKSEPSTAQAFNVSLLKEPAEVALYASLSKVSPQADAAFSRGDYTASLQTLAALKIPVDTFFDTVMVNTEDAELRANRLNLLAQLHAAMNRVADLSKLVS